MPLFMDIHKFDEITVEEVKKAHLADVSVQEQFGVKHHQFWVNEKAGLAFCLMEGPDKESCQSVHQLAHGATACNIVEVEPGFFKLFMGDGQPVAHDLVLNENGSADPGYRHIMVIDIRANTEVVRSDDYKQLFMPFKAKNLVLDRIARFNGRIVENRVDDNQVGVFNSALSAIRCAKDLKNEFIKRKKNRNANQEWNITFRIGLNTGQPLTEHAGFFKEALTLTRRLCLVAREDDVVVSAATRNLCSIEDIYPLKSLTQDQETFMNQLFDHAEGNLSNKNFCLDDLGRNLGVSRPQLYRKISSITGLSPNEFISNIRMTKAVILMKKNFGNISEIAREVGYQNPSYFTKCFQKNYGCTPSKFNKIRDLT